MLLKPMEILLDPAGVGCSAPGSDESQKPVGVGFDSRREGVDSQNRQREIADSYSQREKRSFKSASFAPSTEPRA